MPYDTILNDWSDFMIENILSDLIINNVTGIYTLYSGENESSKRKDRPMWSVTFKYEGETEYICKGKKYISNINNPLILPKGSDYEWKCTKAGHFCGIEFDSELTCDEIIPFNLQNPDKLMKIYKQLEQKQIVKPLSYKIDLMKGVYDAISLLLNSMEKNYIPSKNQEKIKPAIDYIALNYNKKIKNDELAKLCTLSTAHFRNLFKEVMEISPISYIHTVRISKAKEMLRSDFNNISDIAYSLGYSSIYEFSKTFKKHIGISPSQYIKNNMLS